MEQNKRNGNFTYNFYREMLRAFIDKNYSFEFFEDVTKLLEQNKRFVLLRHDIDVELGKALKIAQIEHELGVKSTYFFLLRTQHYNIFTQKNTEIVNKILALGHKAGIHFDCAAYSEEFTEENLADACKTEVAIFENWFDCKISIISYHRPGKFVLSANEKISGGYLHTYLPIFTESIEYKADSRGLWRFGNPLESQAFSNSKPMQINVHPIWWNENEISANQALFDALKRKKLELQQSFMENFTIFKLDTNL